MSGRRRVVHRRRGGVNWGSLLQKGIAAAPHIVSAVKSGLALRNALKGQGRRRRVHRPVGKGLLSSAFKLALHLHKKGLKGGNLEKFPTVTGLPPRRMGRTGILKTYLKPYPKSGGVTMGGRRRRVGGIGFNPLGALIGATRGLLGIGHRRRRVGTGSRAAAMHNPWIQHVKAYQSAHGCTYREAMMGARASYRR